MGDHHQVLMASNNNINIPSSNTTKVESLIGDQKKAKPPEQLNCPRCNSSNTKFCYYNNYSLTQPRYFCKTCRRYWTEGGSLRNVPVGGGSRRNKKSSSTSSSSSSSMMVIPSKIPDLNPPNGLSHFSPSLQGGQDLNLAFTASNGSYVPSNSKGQGEISGGIGQPNQNPSFVVPGGFAFQELKPSTSNGGVTQGFCVDGLGIGSARYNNGFRIVPERNILFPFGGEMKHVEADQNKLGQGNNITSNNNPSGYWSGLLGGGSSW